MYAEIKSTDKILINRLDENEQILLEEMYKKGILPSSKLELEQLTDESGDFGGVLLNFISSEDNKDVIIETEIPKSLSLTVGDNYDLTIDTNLDKSSQVICAGTDNYNNMSVVNSNYGIGFTANNVSDKTKFYFSITADGYNVLSKSIDVKISPKTTQRVQLYPYDINGNYIEGFEGISYTIEDESGTEYITSYSEAYNCFYVDLPVGVYYMSFELDGYEPVYYDNYEITQDMMISPSTISLDVRFDTPSNIQY